MNSSPFVALAAFLGLALSMGGCSSAPPMTQSGFLSDYSKLREVNEHRMNYVSPELNKYQSFIVDPVQVRSQQGELSPADRAEVAAYFHDAFAKVLSDRGYTITTKPGLGTARVRLALTSVQESTWWMKLHPASKLAGAGRGGASMEGEVIDATTGAQLAAVVQAGVGSQFTALNFTTVSDIKNTIDGWARTAGSRLDELRASPGATAAADKSPAP